MHITDVSFIPIKSPDDDYYYIGINSKVYITEAEAKKVALELNQQLSIVEVYLYIPEDDKNED